MIRKGFCPAYFDPSVNCNYASRLHGIENSCYELYLELLPTSLSRFIYQVAMLTIRLEVVDEIVVPIKGSITNVNSAACLLASVHFLCD